MYIKQNTVFKGFVIVSTPICILLIRIDGQSIFKFPNSRIDTSHVVRSAIGLPLLTVVVDSKCPMPVVDETLPNEHPSLPERLFQIEPVPKHPP